MTDGPWLMARRPRWSGWCAAAFALAFAVALCLGRAAQAAAQAPVAWAKAIAEAYPDAGRLADAGQRVVCAIDPAHPDDVFRSSASRARHLRKLSRLKERVEFELAGVPCLVVHCTQVGVGDVDRSRVAALLILNRGRRISREVDERLYQMIRVTTRPTLAVSGSCQHAVRAFGGKTGRMRRLGPGEPDPRPDFAKGWFKEAGPTTVRLAQRDPVFGGLADEFTVKAYHSYEVKTLPERFVLLASSSACRVHLARLRDKPLYVVQGNPELYDDSHPDGRVLLRNFFAGAGIDVQRTVPAALAAFRSRVLEGVEHLYAKPAALREATEPTVAAIHMEHPDSVREELAADTKKLRRLKSRLASLSGWRPVLVHYTQIAQSDFDNPAIRAIAISGMRSPRIDVLTRELYALLRETRTPTIGFCGGHQQIARAHGAQVRPMRKLQPGEEDPAPQYQPGMFKEWGFTRIRMLKSDPIFEGLGPAPVMSEYHAAEVADVPDGFDLLASTEECRVQAIRHRTKLMVGVQFHPENYSRMHPHGRALLRNFFGLAQAESAARERRTNE